MQNEQTTVRVCDGVCVRVYWELCAHVLCRIFTTVYLRCAAAVYEGEGSMYVCMCEGKEEAEVVEEETAWYFVWWH